MKEAVTKVIDTLTQEDFHGALPKLLERYNKCIAFGGGNFEEDSQVESYQRLKKWYLMLPCLALSIIRYGSRVK